MQKQRPSRNASPRKSPAKTFGPEKTEEEKKHDRIFQHVQEMFAGSVEAEVVFMVLSECEWRESDAINSLLSMCDSGPKEKSGLAEIATSLLSDEVASARGSQISPSLEALYIADEPVVDLTAGYDDNFPVLAGTQESSPSPHDNSSSSSSSNILEIQDEAPYGPGSKSTRSPELKLSPGPIRSQSVPPQAKSTSSSADDSPVRNPTISVGMLGSPSRATPSGPEPAPGTDVSYRKKGPRGVPVPRDPDFLPGYLLTQNETLARSSSVSVLEFSSLAPGAKIVRKKNDSDNLEIDLLERSSNSTVLKLTIPTSSQSAGIGTVDENRSGDFPTLPALSDTYQYSEVKSGNSDRCFSGATGKTDQDIHKRQGEDTKLQSLWTEYIQKSKMGQILAPVASDVSMSMLTGESESKVKESDEDGAISPTDDIDVPFSKSTVGSGSNSATLSTDSILNEVDQKASEMAVFDDPAILSARVNVVSPQQTRKFPVRLLSKSPEEIPKVMNLYPAARSGNSSQSVGKGSNIVEKDSNQSDGNLSDDSEDGLLKMIYETARNDESEAISSSSETDSAVSSDHQTFSPRLQRTVATKRSNSFPEIQPDGIKSSSHPMTLPVIGLSAEAPEFVPQIKKPKEDMKLEEPVETSSVESDSHSGSELKEKRVQSPQVVYGASPVSSTKSLTTGLPETNLVGSPMFITPKWVPMINNSALPGHPPANGPLPPTPPLPQVGPPHPHPHPLQSTMVPPQMSHMPRYFNPHMPPPVAPPNLQPRPPLPFAPARLMPYTVRGQPIFHVSSYPGSLNHANVPPVPVPALSSSHIDMVAMATGSPIMSQVSSMEPQKPPGVWPTPLPQPVKTLDKLLNQEKITTYVKMVEQHTQQGDKLLVILRGLPGSGKSTLARFLKQGGVILSTDDYFVRENMYDYDAGKLAESHKWNRERAREAMKMGTNPIIIDNTNTQKWEFKPYINMAINNGYDVEIIEPDTPWKFKPKELALRTIHGVPKEHIKRMKERYEHGLTVEKILNQNNKDKKKGQKLAGSKGDNPELTKRDLKYSGSVTDMNTIDSDHENMDSVELEFYEHRGDFFAVEGDDYEKSHLEWSFDDTQFIPKHYAKMSSSVYGSKIGTGFGYSKPGVREPDYSAVEDFMYEKDFLKKKKLKKEKDELMEDSVKDVKDEESEEESVPEWYDTDLDSPYRSITMYDTDSVPSEYKVTDDEEAGNGDGSKDPNKVEGNEELANVDNLQHPTEYAGSLTDEESQDVEDTGVKSVIEAVEVKEELNLSTGDGVEMDKSESSVRGDSQENSTEEDRSFYTCSSEFPSSQEGSPLVGASSVHGSPSKLASAGTCSTVQEVEDDTSPKAALFVSTDAQAEDIYVDMETDARANDATNSTKAGMDQDDGTNKERMSEDDASSVEADGLEDYYAKSEIQVGEGLSETCTTETVTIAVHELASEDPLNVSNSLVQGNLEEGTQICDKKDKMEEDVSEDETLACIGITGNLTSDELQNSNVSLSAEVSPDKFDDTEGQVSGDKVNEDLNDMEDIKLEEEIEAESNLEDQNDDFETQNSNENVCQNKNSELQNNNIEIDLKGSHFQSGIIDDEARTLAEKEAGFEGKESSHNEDVDVCLNVDPEVEQMVTELFQEHVSDKCLSAAEAQTTEEELKALLLFLPVSAEQQLVAENLISFKLSSMVQKEDRGLAHSDKNGKQGKTKSKSEENHKFGNINVEKSVDRKEKFRPNTCSGDKKQSDEVTTDELRYWGNNPPVNMTWDGISTVVDNWETTLDRKSTAAAVKSSSRSEKQAKDIVGCSESSDPLHKDEKLTWDEPKTRRERRRGGRNSGGDKRDAVVDQDVSSENGAKSNLSNIHYGSDGAEIPEDENSILIEPVSNKDAVLGSLLIPKPGLVSASVLTGNKIGTCTSSFDVDTSSFDAEIYYSDSSPEKIKQSPKFNVLNISLEDQLKNPSLVTSSMHTHKSSGTVIDSVENSGKLSDPKPGSMESKVPVKKHKSTRRKLAANFNSPFFPESTKQTLMNSDWVALNKSAENKLKGSVVNRLDEVESGPGLYNKGTNTDDHDFRILSLTESSDCQENLVELDFRILTGTSRNIYCDGSSVTQEQMSEGVMKKWRKDKSTMTSEGDTVGDDEIMFLRHCFANISEDELTCVLKSCGNNVEWAINLFLDWKYNLYLSEEEKQKFIDTVCKVQHCKKPRLRRTVSAPVQSPVKSLLDLCYSYVDKMNIASREDIEQQLIKTGKDRLDRIENAEVIKFKRSVSLSESTTYMDRIEKSKHGALDHSWSLLKKEKEIEFNLDERKRLAKEELASKNKMVNETTVTLAQAETTVCRNSVDDADTLKKDVHVFEDSVSNSVFCPAHSMSVQDVHASTADSSVPSQLESNSGEDNFNIMYGNGPLGFHPSSDYYFPSLAGYYSPYGQLGMSHMNGHDPYLASGAYYYDDAKSAIGKNDVAATEQEKSVTSTDTGQTARTDEASGVEEQERPDVVQTSPEQARLDSPSMQLDSGLSLTVSDSFLQKLQQLFGPIDIPENVHEIPVDLRTAKLIHHCLKRRVPEHNKELQLQKDEAFARQLQAEEDQQQRRDTAGDEDPEQQLQHNSPAVGLSIKGFRPKQFKPVPKVQVKPLKEIIEEELAAQSSEEEQQRLVKWDPNRAALATRMKRQQLYETFPGIDEPVLDDLFMANSFNFDDTVNAIKKFLGSDCGPPQTVMTEGARQAYEEKLVEAAKQQSLQDMLDSCLYTPMVKKDFQASEEPGYEDYRGEANIHYRLRHECFQKAQEAFRRGMKQVATFYSQQGHLHAQKIKESNMRASEKILQERNSSLEQTNILDLHGLHVDEARAALERILPEKEIVLNKTGDRRKQYLTIVTGRGSHSRGGVAKLRPAVMDYLQRNQYRFTEQPVGCFKVILKYRHPD